MSIFKAYDIRGKYPEELDETMAYRIGRAAAGFFTCNEIVVGRDGRLSSEPIFEHLTAGIKAKGVNVVDIGRVTTPILYYTVARLGLQAGIMITASHNPREYNGFKFCREEAIPVFDNDLQEIARIAREQNENKSAHPGTITRKDPFPDYLSHISQFIPQQEKKFKVVIDAGNAVCGEVIPKLYCNLNLEIIPLYFELDGNFPNHQPNPLDETTLADLREMVEKNNADLGIAFDGDGDRVFFLDERGEVIAADLITLLIAVELTENRSDHLTVVYDCRSSWIVRDELGRRGINLVQSRVGHTFIKHLMRKYQAIFAGELSGHFYFRDCFYTESSDVALFKLLKILSNRKQKLSQIVQPYRVYFPSGEINSDVSDKDSKIKEIERLYSSGKISYIDGLTVEFPDWWFNLRPSNTEPLLRLNVEAKTKELMEKQRDELLSRIRD